MPSSICLNHHLWSDLTEFCRALQIKSYSSADFSLCPARLSVALTPSFPSNPRPTSVRSCLFQPSFSCSYPPHRSHRSPRFHSIHPSRSSLSSPISVSHPSSVSSSLMYPLSVSFSSPSQPSISTPPPPVLSPVRPVSSFSSPGEVNRNWFLPIASQASPEREKCLQ